MACISSRLALDTQQILLMITARLLSQLTQSKWHEAMRSSHEERGGEMGEGEETRGVGGGGGGGHSERLTQCACSAAVVSQGRHGDALLEAP